MTKKLREKFKYLENKKSFYKKQQTFLIIFKGFSVAKYCLRPESVPLIALYLLQEHVTIEIKNPNKR